jgi:HAD superfamily hydrolase (TIGR01662 family)
VSGSVDIVVPSARADALARLLAALGRAGGPPGDGRVVVADDRPRGGARIDVPAALAGRVEIVRSGARGPAAARNAGWRRSDADWVAFLDDDVEPDLDWSDRLADDLAACGPQAGATQGRIAVPLPLGRRPTDRERGVRGLQDAAWATADMAYRRRALLAVGGFDEGFPRAYREDADLALRVRQAGWTLERGTRCVRHPAPPAPWTASLRAQRGNADDARMRAKHGPDWRTLAEVPRGRRRTHLATVALGAVAAAGAATGAAPVARLAGAGWAALTADFARRRIAPGPRDPREVATMAATSALIPPLAAWHLARGTAANRATPRHGFPAPPAAVLLDRDGTLVHDVPYNGDPALVQPVADARTALDRLRAAGVRVGVVSNQSGIARGRLTREQVDAVHARLQGLLGPLGPIEICPHGPGDGCGCRKPRPGMVVAAAQRLGVRPQDCVVIGDIGADVGAATAAGARSILVPTPVTREAEIAAAAVVCRTLTAAVDLLLGERTAAEPAAPVAADEPVAAAA